MLLLYYVVGEGIFFYYGLLVSFIAFYAISTSFSSFLDQIFFFLFFFASFGYKFSALPLFQTSSYYATSVSTHKTSAYHDFFLSLLSYPICFVWSNIFSSFTSWWTIWRNKMIMWSWVLSKVHIMTIWQFSRHLRHLLPYIQALRFLSMFQVPKWFLSFEENGRTRTLLDRLKKHTCIQNSIGFNNNNGCC